MTVVGPGLKLAFIAKPIADLAGFLSTLAAADRPVIDASGLAGSYSITLDLNEAVRPGRSGDAPSVSTLLQEHLGPPFEGRRRAIEVWKVDHPEQPR
jgi:uncharacterized protein (TIGR03435 family)